MADKVQFRKCPECGNKMILKKSRKYNSKFWACSSFPDCDKTFEYHGPGGRAGVDIDIRGIENGYIIRIIQKHPLDDADDEPVDIYCADVPGVRSKLGDIFDEQIPKLVERLESDTQFDEEPDPKVKRKRSKTAKRGETDIKELLARHKKAKKRASEEPDA